uniref:Uncharacterized protein n=1 Tax=Rhizophora mucronata TaxID=61149 RepID=A0A2P2NIF4_RHIMU
MRSVGGLKDRGLQSEFPSPSEFISSNGLDDRAIEKVSNANPVENFQCQMQPSDCMQFMSPDNRTQGHSQEASCSTLPAGFTALLSDCCTAIGQEVPNRPVAFDLKSQVVVFSFSLCF